MNPPTNHQPINAPQTQVVHIPIKDMVFFFEKQSSNTVSHSAADAASQQAKVRAVASLLLETQVEQLRGIKSEFNSRGREPPRIIITQRIIAGGDIYEGTIDSTVC